MLDVARSMAALPSASNRWADAPAQLVSSRLEQGARLASTTSGSIDSTASSSRWPESSLRTATDSSEPASRLERAESFMSTGTASSGLYTAATITKASTATIRKVERTNASARPIRFTKSKKDTESITPSSSVEHMSSRSTDATEYQSSPIFAGDHSQSTVTTSFDTTVRSPTDEHRRPATTKFGGATVSSSHIDMTLDLAEPKSFFSDSLSGDDFTRSMSATASRLASLNPDTLRFGPSSRRGSEQATSDLSTAELHASEMSHSSSYQSATSSLANSAESLPQLSRATRYTGTQPSASHKPAAGAKFGLGIQTRGPMSSSHHQQIADNPIAAARYLAGPSLEVVPEARESPYLGSRASQAASTPDMGAPSALTISTAIPPNNEPIWGESSSSVNAGTTNPAFGPMATFSFPSPVPSSAGFNNAPTKPGHSGSLSARYPRSPGSAFHSSNPSMQSSVSNANARHPFSSKSGASDAGLLHASDWRHAPPSSYGGSIISSTGGTSALGFASLNPNNRDDMLHRLLLDQARVDCQEYGTMSLEQVAEAKRDLKHVERKVQSLRTKLKVEIKIRDAAVALRKAHRRTAASAHSPTSSVSLAVSPTSPGFATTQIPGSSLAASSSSSSSSSFAARSRALSISATEAKADDDVNVATAKVDKVANELFKWIERANSLRRKLLEHQAATLSERVHHLESDRQVMEEKLPFLTASASFESLAPSASASAVGIARYRDAGHRYQPSADEPYIPRGPEDPLRHNRLESDLSAISGFSFLDATAPEKLRRIGEELERKREMVRKLELEMDSARDAARRRDATSDRLTQQLEEQSRERSRAVEELRTLREQMNRQDESARQAQAKAVQSAITEVEQRMQGQIEQSRSRDQEKEDALVNAKAEVMAGQRALTELQGRLHATQEETKALRLRAEAAEKASQEEVTVLQMRLEAAEKASDEHKRKLDDMHGESTRQLNQGSQDLASLQAELRTVKAAQDNAGKLAADRARTIDELQGHLKQVRDTLGAEKEALAVDHVKAIANLEEQLRQVRSELSAEKQTRAQAEERAFVAQKKIVDTQARADDADVKLRELELAVGAERRIMAERDELFHAFERRLESAEQRLQEQDKRCARMLGKLEGREEMDDLLERIKAGAAGVFAKKEKTAGQDIAALLSSLETHIGDLELELARANAQISGSPRHSVAAPDAPAATVHHAQLEASFQEVQLWKTEAERLETLLNPQRGNTVETLPEDQKRLQDLEAENERSQRQGEERVVRLEAEVRTLSEQKDELERQGLERVKQLEGKLEQLEATNRDLEKRLRNASNPASPAASIDALPLRASKSASPHSSTFQVQNKGVVNLIDRFGGGRKVSSELRADDSAAMLQACIRSAENLRAMLPDLPAAAKGSADLQALRNAFQKSAALPASPTAPTSARTFSGTADLQAELDATAERLRSTLAISRAVIDLALESEADKGNRGDSEREEQQAVAARAQADAMSSQQALVTRITSLTAKVKEQTNREKRLKAELAEAKEQLEEARAVERAPSSPYGLTLGSDSMIGLSTSPAKSGESNFFGMPRSLGRTSSNKSMRTLLGDRPSPISTNAYVPGGATLAPPRSPSAFDALPSPTRSNISVHSSPSIRYISPFAPPIFDTRNPQRPLPESRSNGADDLIGNAPISESSNNAEMSESMSLRSVSSPSSTHLGLPSSAASLTGTSQSSIPMQRAGAEPSQASSPTPNGVIKRTITLGMDVPQLVSRVRELERQLSQTSAIRQRAERAAELETQLREANQAYTKLLDRMDAERNIGTHQKVEILNELNDAQSKLQTTQAQMQRAQSVSPFASPLPTFRPLPPPKD
ncbi:uncharacterized protein UTRI_03365_B [Ustilago trichophora]|uniref:Up-regulated during septation protein 1 domain-containing protein n=1 Tax=Ustilago trichophora TaxID=86804 RepID=A0A5C3E0S8_9BASI|nr:uncharacterized protein UTRI_03365_B [Ustilago trichophora]